MVVAGRALCAKQFIDAKERTVTQDTRIPSGWIVGGTNARSYDMGVEAPVSPSQPRVAYVKSREPCDGFATLMQHFKADAYRGKRVRFAASVRSEGVSGWAGLWMRVDGASGQMVAFDNMFDRAIRENTDWTRYAVVLDVAEGAAKIALGILLHEQGQVWIKEFAVEVVGEDVPSTNTLDRDLADGPQNLDLAL